MDQELRLPDPTEPVTDTEVRELIERFGERQTLTRDQPTVADVAEALQVEPKIVGSMLFELRRSKSQTEVSDGLARLEEENAELRRRAEVESGQVIPALRSSGDPTVRSALIAALCILTALTVAGGLLGERQWWLGSVPIVFALIALSRFGPTRRE